MVQVEYHSSVEGPVGQSWSRDNDHRNNNRSG